MKKGLYRGVMTVSAGLLAVMVLTGCGAKKKGAADFISATFHGINSEGTLSLSFDREALTEELSSGKQLTEREKEELISLLSGIEKDYIISKKDGLSNGDEVEIKGGLDKKLLKDYGVVFDNNAVTVTVEGLADRIEINVGDYLSGTTDGFEGGGSCNLTLDRQGINEAVAAQAALVDGTSPDEQTIWDITDKCLSGLSVEPWYFGGLSSGDVIHASVTLEETEIPEYGITFTASDYEEKASGFAPYETVSLSDYLTLAQSGYDTFAAARADLDAEKLVRDLAAILRKDGRTSAGRASSETDFDEEAEILAGRIGSAFRGSFETSLSVSENLSNGDKVTVTCTPEADAADESGAVRLPAVGVTLTGGTAEAEVQGLPGTAVMDLSEYVSLSFEGFEGAGTASVVYDAEGFRNALNELICRQDPTLDPQSYSYYNGESILLRSEADIRDMTALSNGREVTAEITPSVPSIPEYGILFEASPVEGTAEGLAPTQEIDLTEAVSVTFSGICPYVTAETTVDSECPVYYDTSLSEIGGRESITAENGDTYEIKIGYDADALLQKGYVVTNDTCVFTVSGLDTWTLALEDGNDVRLTGFAALAEKLAREEFSRRAGDIAESLTGGSGWVIWKDVGLQTEKVWYAAASEDYGHRNAVCFTGAFTVPVRDAGRGITEKKAGWTAWIYDVTAGPGGNFRSENEPEVSVRYSGEDYEGELREELFYDLGDTEIVVMERTAGAGGPGENADSSSEAAESAEEAVPAADSAEEPAEGTAAEETPEEDRAESPELPEWTRVTRQSIAPVYADPETAALACGGPVVLDGHTYYEFSQIGEKTLTWTAAEVFCEEAGGHLATIGSLREQCALQSLLEDGERNCYWIGAEDKNYEGYWNWVTGEPFDFTYWREDGQPDNYDGRENYLALYMNYDGRWNDLANDDGEPGFVLEMEPEEEPGEADQKVNLAELTPSVSANRSVRTSVRDPYGNLYYESVAFDTGRRAVSEYDLDGKYDSLVFTLSTSEDTDSGASMDLLIWGDARLLFASCGYTRSEAPISAEISLAGVNRLSVQTAGRGYAGYLFLNDALLTKADTETDGDTETKERDVFLADLEMVSGSDAEVKTFEGVQTDISGNLLRDALVLDTGNQGEATFGIPDGAGVFTAGLSMGSVPDAENAPVSVEFYGDDSLLGRYTLSAWDGLLPVELDLSGVSLLTVRAGNAGGSSQNRQVILSGFRIAGAAAEDAGGLPQPVFPKIDPAYEAQAARILTCGSYRYYRFDRPMAVNQIRDFCLEAGGIPAVIKTPEQNLALTKLVEGSSWNICNGYWLGCSYDNVRSFWHWDDDTALLDSDYQNWSEDVTEKRNLGGQNLYLMTDGTWNMSSARNRHGLIMQVKAEDHLLPDRGEPLTGLAPVSAVDAELLDYTKKEGKYLEYLPSTVRMNAEASGFAEFSLSGRYRAMTATAETAPDTDVNSRTDFAVFGDGVLLYSRRGISAGTGPVPFVVDLTGVQSLKIMSSSRGYASLLMEKAVLYPAEETSGDGAARLSALTVVDSKGSDHTDSLVKDVYGGLHDSARTLNVPEEGSVLYNLEGRYTSLSLRLVSTAGTRKTGSRKVRILLDQDTVYEETLDGYFRFDEPLVFDVTGRTTLRIETAPLADGSDSIGVADDRLLR